MKRSSTVFAALLAAGALALAGCGSTPADNSADKTQAPPVVEKTTEASATPSASPTEDSEETGGDSGTSEGLQKLAASTTTAKDPEREDTATVKSIALGFVGTGQYAKAPGNNTYVAVEYEVTRGTKYYGGVSCTSLRLSTPDSRTPQSHSTSLVKDEMVKQGLTPLDKIESGKGATGWCMYYVPNPTKDNLTVTYERSAAKSGDKEIPEFTAELPIKVG